MKKIKIFNLQYIQKLFNKKADSPRKCEASSEITKKNIIRSIYIYRKSKKK